MKEEDYTGRVLTEIVIRLDFGHNWEGWKTLKEARIAVADLLRLWFSSRLKRILCARLLRALSSHQRTAVVDKA